MNLDSYIRGVWSLNITNKNPYFNFGNDGTLTHVWGIMRDISCGLTFIHSLGEVHRDLKPRNGLLQNLNVKRLTAVLYSQAQNMWKITDFGSTAKGTSNAREVTVYSRGTPSYRAPELLAEPPLYNNRADIWALGCILFEIVTAEKAFSGDWGVRDFALSAKLFELPLNKVRFANVSTSVLSGLVRDMLRTELSHRPAARYLLKSFSTLVEDALAQGSSQITSATVVSGGPLTGIFIVTVTLHLIFLSAARNHRVKSSEPEGTVGPIVVSAGRTHICCSPTLLLSGATHEDSKCADTAFLRQSRGP